MENDIKTIYKPKFEIKYDDYKCIDGECFYIRNLQGFGVVKITVSKELGGIVLNWTTSDGIRVYENEYIQKFIKNYAHENEKVMDLIKCLYYDKYNKLQSKSYRVLPIGRKAYDMLHSFAALQKFRTDEIKKETEEQLSDLKQYLNIY